MGKSARCALEVQISGTNRTAGQKSSQARGRRRWAGIITAASQSYGTKVDCDRFIPQKVSVAVSKQQGFPGFRAMNAHQDATAELGYGLCSAGCQQW